MLLWATSLLLSLPKDIQDMIYAPLYLQSLYSLRQSPAAEGQAVSPAFLHQVDRLKTHIYWTLLKHQARGRND